MLLRTHLAFAVFVVILFFEHVQNKFIFVLMVLVATIIPDIDMSNSSLGKHLIFKPLQFITSHRGIVHSFSVGILISAILAVFWPVASLGFFIGYSTHLIVDSFTKEGVQPFWPLKLRSKGFIASGGRIEEGILVFLILIDVLFAFLVLGS